MTAPDKSSLLDGGWIEWTGGECPVPAETLVQVKFSFGKCFGDWALAAQLRWDHRGNSADIIAYRLPPQAEASAFSKAPTAGVVEGLKPCAHCGGTPLYILDPLRKEREGKGHVIECTKCGCNIARRKLAKATDAWNCRIPTSPEPSLALPVVGASRWTPVSEPPAVGGSYLIGGYREHGFFDWAFGAVFLTLNGPEWSCDKEHVPIQFWADIPPHPRSSEHARLLSALAPLPVGGGDAEGCLTDVVAFSADIESGRVLKLHFSREVTNADRERLLRLHNQRISAPAPTPAAPEVELVAALDRIFSLVSYVNLHGVGEQPTRCEDGAPQPMRVPNDEFWRIFQEIGKLSGEAATKAETALAAQAARTNGEVRS